MGIKLDTAAKEIVQGDVGNHNRRWDILIIKIEPRPGEDKVLAFPAFQNTKGGSKETNKSCFNLLHKTHTVFDVVCREQVALSAVLVLI